MNANCVAGASFTVAALFCLLISDALSQQPTQVDSSVKKAVLAVTSKEKLRQTVESAKKLEEKWREKWQAVYNACGPVQAPESNPVLRAIKGHACLALNRNNESVRLFLSLSRESGRDDSRKSDRDQWNEWASEFAETNSASPVAHYFSGDAAARLGSWTSAVNAYYEAIKLDSGFAMALNARSVAYAEVAARAKTKEQRKSLVDLALEDLDKACEKNPSLADAWASRGTLMLMEKLVDEAFSSFEKALEKAKTPGEPDKFALALNGRGCAWYGRVRPEPKLENAWEEANKDFAQAGRNLPLPIVLWNLHALGVAVENVAAPDLVNSALFGLTDFLDWDALRESTKKEGDVFRTFYGRELPEKATQEVISELNRALENARFCEQIEGQLQLEKAPEKLVALVKETKAARSKDSQDLTDEEKGEIRFLNRLLIEMAYPFLVAKHDHRDPGMQLTLRHGFVDAWSYKSSLSPSQLTSGYNRMETYRTWVDAAKTLPFTGGVLSPLERHLNNQMGINRTIYQAQTGRDLDPAGVSADLRQAYIERAAELPVTNWFGLAQTVAISSAGKNENTERQR